MNYPYTPKPDPPSDQVVANFRAQMARDADHYIQNGGSKVVRVRIQIEFTNGEEIGAEYTA